MFDVYLNEKRDRLLVIARGQPIPVIEKAGRWRKKKATLAISDEIKIAVKKDGFYWRSLRKSTSLPNENPTPLSTARLSLERSTAADQNHVAQIDRRRRP